MPPSPLSYKRISTFKGFGPSNIYGRVLKVNQLQRGALLSSGLSSEPYEQSYEPSATTVRAPYEHELNTSHMTPTPLSISIAIGCPIAQSQKALLT